MRVRNNSDAGVFVKGYGVVPPDEEATVSAEAGKAAVKQGVLTEVKASSGSSGSGGSQTNNERDDG